MEKDFVQHALIEPNIDSYKQFFDHGWCESMFALARASPLENAVDKLMVAWRSTNGVHMLPWLLIQSLRGFANGDYKGTLGFWTGYSGTVIKGICDKLEARMPTLSFEQRMALGRAVTAIEKEAFDTIRAIEPQVKVDVERYIEQYWEFVTNASEFTFSILGSQRINYGSLFFAYEDFLANTIRIREPTYSSR
jgi:hypothetical protein